MVAAPAGLVERGDWRFGIAEGGVAAFLAAFGFEVKDEASPAELERRYFTDAAGGNHGRVNGTQAIVTAAKKQER